VSSDGIVLGLPQSAIPWAREDKRVENWEKKKVKE